MKKAKTTKRLLAGLLALLLAVTGVPLYGIETKAAELTEGTEGEYSYQINADNSSVMITGYSGNGGTISIPDTIDGKTVTAIGNNAFINNIALTGLTIPDNVTYIGQWAFSDCSNLASLSISKKVTCIDTFAFSGCSSLTSLSLPDSVTTIGDSAFSGCSSLASLSLPDSVTTIGNGAFSGCSSLASLFIPGSVTSIGEGAFYNCSALESITVGEGNTVYDSRDTCNSIITKKDNALILGCKNTIIPDSVDSIGIRAFYGCSNLENLTIPNNVSSIGFGAFEGCSSLISITLPDNVTLIDCWTFSGCSSLKSIALPNNVTAIRETAFLGCSSLAGITIPGNVTTIGEYAFGYIPNLYNPTIMEKIKDFTIYGVSGTAAETYATQNGFQFTSTGIIKSDLSLAEITLEGGENSSYVWDGTPQTPAVTVKLDGKTLIQDTDYTVSYSNNTDIGRAEVTVTGLGDYLGTQTTSFWIEETGWEGDYKYQVNEDGNSVTILKCDRGNSAEIPATINGKTVTAIGYEAFRLSGWDSSPASLTIPDSVTSVGGYAFYHWRNLKSVTIPSTVTSIGDYAFGFYEYEYDPDEGGEIVTKKIPDFIIYGESGSAAEAYAAKNGFPFNEPGTGGDTGNNPPQNGGSQGTESQTDLSTATVTLEKDTYPYDGKAKTPAVTVTLSGKTLTQSTDYTVSYSNNTNVGTAKATATGKGNYKGSVTKTFTITAANSPAGDNGSSDGNGSAGTSSAKQPITCKKKAYTVAYGTKPFKLKVTSNGSLTYQSSNSKIAAVGRTNGKVTIKNTGTAYITAKTKTDSVKITINVYPKKSSVKSLSVGKGRKLTVKWAKDRKATGYQVQICTSKNFKKNVKKQNITKTACTFKKLKAGSKYYVRLRSFKKSGKNTLYSAWSKPKKSSKIKR